MRMTCAVENADAERPRLLAGASASSVQAWHRTSISERHEHATIEPRLHRGLREVAADPATREVYVVTNNHYKGKAVPNALMMKSMMGGGTVTAPPGVYEAYRESLEGYAEPAPEAELNTG